MDFSFEVYSTNYCTIYYFGFIDSAQSLSNCQKIKNDSSFHSYVK